MSQPSARSGNESATRHSGHAALTLASETQPLVEGSHVHLQPALCQDRHAPLT